MKRFLRFAIAATVTAVSIWSCGKDPVDIPEAENSYIHNGAETAIVWAGVEIVEGTYTIYLASEEPASITSPITIEGLTVTLPASLLGTEVELGTDGTGASLNGTPLTGGNLKVSIQSTTLSVDITDSKVNGGDFTANWNGVFSNVEPDISIPPDYDETLNNEWQYDGTAKVGIRYVELKEYDDDTYTGLALSLSDGDPLFNEQISKWYLLNTIALYMPTPKLGQDVLMVEDGLTDSWSLDFWLNDGQDVYYKGEGAAPNAIVAGKMNIARVGMNVNVKVAVRFTDGAVLRANYSGPAKDLDIFDPIPDTNQWSYEGLLSNIDVSSVEYSAQNESRGLGTFAMMNSDGYRVAVFMLPLAMLSGEDILLQGNTAYDWGVRYFVGGEQIQMSAKSGVMDMTSGKVNAIFSKTTKKLTLAVDIVYMGYIHFRVNYDDSIIIPENIESIDELVGVWNVTETELIPDGTLFDERNNDHAITISKIDASTIEIDNFTGWGSRDGRADKVRATINSNKEMVIGANQEFIPSWNSSYTTNLLPYLTTPVSSNVGRAFPAQTFNRVGNTITMSMRTGNVTITTGYGNPYTTTYMVGALQGGVYKSYFNIYAGTFWVNQSTSSGTAPFKSRYKEPLLIL